VQVKLALPKGLLQGSVSTLLANAGTRLDGYEKGSRVYRLQCEEPQGLFVKVFQEKDIAIQVAMGNYDLGICRLDWIEELLSGFPSDAVVKVRDLGFGKRILYLVASDQSEFDSAEAIRHSKDSLRIASEYPNLATSFALKERLRRFRIFPVWGAADCYPPENAELAVVAVSNDAGLRDNGSVPVTKLLDSRAFLIANRHSLENKDLGAVLSPLLDARLPESEPDEPQKKVKGKAE
jgi:ATP phosphoribosyltransferase